MWRVTQMSVSTMCQGTLASAAPSTRLGRGAAIVLRFITVLLVASALFGSVFVAASAASAPTGADFLRLCSENKPA